MEEKKEVKENVSSSTKSQEKLYGDIPALPTQTAVLGMRFDFNSGLRFFIPEEKVKYHLKFSDEDTGLVMFDSDIESNSIISSNHKYFIKYHITLTERESKKVVFDYVMDLKGKKVVVQFPVRTLGDSIAWFSNLETFQKKHGCELYVVIADFIKEIFEKQYPDFHFIKKEEVLKLNSYASYYLGLFWKDSAKYQPVDFRQVGLHETAGLILGLRTKEELTNLPPRIDLSAKRKIKEKYVVIATKGSTQCKYWNHPMGWLKVIDFLKENGYKIICIDKERVHGKGYVFNYIPWGVEDDTGNKPLQERIDMIKDADFFIGLASGLSWLAWCCKVPVLMISGFSLPKSEFYTPYRVINYSVCNGCWDDIREEFNHSDFFWCPRHKDTERQYECTRLIPPEQVINMIKTIPTFRGEEKK